MTTRISWHAEILKKTIMAYSAFVISEISSVSMFMSCWSKCCSGYDVFQCFSPWSSMLPFGL